MTKKISRNIQKIYLIYDRATDVYLKMLRRRDIEPLFVYGNSIRSFEDALRYCIVFDTEEQAIDMIKTLYSEFPACYGNFTTVCFTKETITEKETLNDIPRNSSV